MTVNFLFSLNLLYSSHPTSHLWSWFIFHWDNKQMRASLITKFVILSAFFLFHWRNHAFPIKNQLFLLCMASHPLSLSQGLCSNDIIFPTFIPLYWIIPNMTNISLSFLEKPSLEPRFLSLHFCAFLHGKTSWMIILSLTLLPNLPFTPVYSKQAFPPYILR